MHAVGTEDVGDLVRVGDDGRRSERDDQAGELVDHQLHRLDVHVRVHEARDDVAAGGIDRLLAVVAAEPGDRPLDDRDVDVEPLAREDAQHAAAAHDHIRGLVASGNCETACEVGHGRQPNVRAER